MVLRPDDAAPIGGAHCAQAHIDNLLPWPAGDPSPDLRCTPTDTPPAKPSLAREEILFDVIVQRRPGQAGSCRNGLELPELFLR
jgi:hypothetical protein